MRPLTGTNRVDMAPPALSSGIAIVWVFVCVVGGPGPAGRDRDRHRLRAALGARHVEHAGGVDAAGGRDADSVAS